ncbi:MAG: tRNA (5-methylaminomethyl-2-thiouridylate)-methyltransferase [Candidatus Cloacimonetes bacterium]|nr:tRNA (5-methylaminomethyl-2-thiouridylate)-methyltransferase [Candidatus Cloacimonadota bacterium]
MKKRTCISLFSGGLDSLLAVKFMEKLGYKVIPVFFETPFFEAGNALEIAKLNGIALQVVDVFEEYLPVLQNPRYGYGKNLNPCIDCHGFMFRTAGKLLEEWQADFLISGEVLGQRPMSQRKDAMNAVGKLSEVKDLLVRPLSQKLLADTLPIREGWVDKNEMLSIQGRGRHRQLELAREFGIVDFQSPGGGCKLTDVKYSRRLRDLLTHSQISLANIRFLKYGRHFRLNEQTKLVVGRHKQDNEHLSLLADTEIVVRAVNIHGPLGIIIKGDIPTLEEIMLAAQIVLRYNNSVGSEADIAWGENFSLNNIIRINKLDEEKVAEFMI